MNNEVEAYVGELRELRDKVANCKCQRKRQQPSPTEQLELPFDDAGDDKAHLEK